MSVFLAVLSNPTDRQEKAALEKSRKELMDAAVVKEAELKSKLNTIGNIVHDSVPVSMDEVGVHISSQALLSLLTRTVV